MRRNRMERTIRGPGMNNMMPYEPPKYPFDAFHTVLRNTAYEILDNIQAPDALIGMSLSAAITAALQGRVNIKLPTGQIRGVSLNFLSIAESGERKSTVDGLAFAAMYERDIRAAEAHQGFLFDYQVALQRWTFQQKRLTHRLNKADRAGEDVEAILAEMTAQAKSKPKKPRLRCYMRQNITPRAIMDALEGDGESIAIATDEGQVMFRSGAMAELGILNKAWDGARLMTLDRADMDHLLVMNPRVTINIMTQKKILMEYLEKHGETARGSGHWARYLVGWPTSTQGERYVPDHELVWRHLPLFQERINTLLDQHDAMMASGKVHRELLEFSEEAKMRWFSLARETEWMLRPGDYLHDINDFASKVMEILGRLAAVFHYFNGEQGKISLDTLERPMTIVIWHVDEYKRLFSPAFVMPQDQVDANELALHLRKNIWGGYGSGSWVAKNHLLNGGPVRNARRLNAALRILEEKGAVRIGPAPKSRRLYVDLNDAFFGSF